LVSSSARASSSVACSGFDGRPIPALLTTIWTSDACSAAAATESASVTSSAIGVSRSSVIEAGLRTAA